jgi:hypothetical protein
MPIISFQAQADGPIVSAAVGVSIPRRKLLIDHGLVVPDMVVGTFLVDTGATVTAVAPDLIASLGLPHIGAVSVHTPSTGATSVAIDQYDASFIIPGNAPDGTLVIGAIPILATHFRSQGIDGLIGRDILNRCMLVYNGTTGAVSLAH